jgi:hypothetical protein
MPKAVLVAFAATLVLAATASAGTGVPRLLFPVVGPTVYYDDFGELRSDGPPHQGNDLLAVKRTAVVAVEDGMVNWWATSKNAGCMLYLHGASGTTYDYIHLNNDLTRANDNKGTCTTGVSYAVGDGAEVHAGDVIGYVGDSGDANGLHAHLHFEVHPHDGKAADPFPFLKKALHLLAPAPPLGAVFTLKLGGTVVTSDSTQLKLSVSTVASWPSHVKQSKVNRVLTLTNATDPGALAPGTAIVVWTQPAAGTIRALTGATGALTVDRVAAS